MTDIFAVLQPIKKINERIENQFILHFYSNTSLD